MTWGLVQPPSTAGLAFFVIGIFTVIKVFSRLSILYIEDARRRRRNGATVDFEQMSNADLDLLAHRHNKEQAWRVNKALDAAVSSSGTAAEGPRVCERAEGESTSSEQKAPSLRKAVICYIHLFT